MTKVEDILAANAAATQFELEVDGGRHPELVVETVEEDGGSVTVIDVQKRARETVRRMKEVLEARGWTTSIDDLDLDDDGTTGVTLMTRGEESLVIHRTEWGQVYIED